MQNRTIAAIASGTAPAAIGVIRISGNGTFNIIQKCLHKNITKNRYMYYRTIYHPETDEPLDDIMICRFAGPNSYTGEDSAEIYAHGGSINLSRVLSAVIAAGAEPAAPGEFSQRAFLNGKMDLSRAEAIMDVIHAQNDLQCREAHRQLSGSVAGIVDELRGHIFSLLVAVEASIDFSQEEELAPFPGERIMAETGRLLDVMERMERAHDQYRAGGMRVAIIGRPNAGKSSLFNELLGHERAIVTDIAGTTTDTIEAPLVLGGLDYILIDTAGLTPTDNIVERLGVERAREQISRADAILLLVPANAAADELKAIRDELEPFGETLRELSASHNLYIIRTKCDLCENGVIPFSADGATPELMVSTKCKRGTMQVQECLVDMARRRESAFENVVLITSARHISLIQKAREAVCHSREAVSAGLPAECVAEDLHEAADALGEITGTIAAEDILNHIFSTFCIGK